MTSKIRIKIGAIEIDYEGTEEFLKQELPELLKTVSELYMSSAPLIEQNGSTADSSSSSQKIQGTTATLAAKLGGGSGPDLIMSAAARLHFVLGKEKFHKKDIAEEIKSATNYFKSSYSSNLVSLLNGLVKSGKLMEPSKDNFSLSADSLKDIGAKLA